MKSVLIAPHNDDESLFASVIMQRMKPKLIVVTDSWVQFNRGQTDITAQRRRDESRAAAEVYGVDIEFLGLRDDKLVEKDLRAELMRLNPVDMVFAPALQGGHLHHDLVSRCAWVAGCATNAPVLHYATYERGQGFTPYGLPLGMSSKEKEIKKQALLCYTSQLWQVHFPAVDGKDEYIS